MSERGGPVFDSTDDAPPGVVMSYPPHSLVFAWGWGDDDQLAAVTVGATVFFLTIVLCQVCVGVHTVCSCCCSFCCVEGR